MMVAVAWMVAVGAGELEGRPMAKAASRAVRGEKSAWERAGVSKEAYDDFQNFWDKFESEQHRGNFAIPRVVVWLNGAPGAGKGTNSAYVRDIFKIRKPAIVTSDLLETPEFEKIKNSGQLVSDGDVTAIVFHKLLEREYADGVLVDGYPRTSVQADCVKLLHDKIQEMRQSSVFQVVIFDVPESVSVERQLGRGARAAAANERASARHTGQGQEVPIRQTDRDPAAAATRYRVFMQQTDDALRVLQKHFLCRRINAEGSFDSVRAEIYERITPLAE
jgi:adenylate kinase